MAPPFFPISWGGRPSPVVGRQRLRHSAPRSSRVTWAAGSGGGAVGCQHLCPPLRLRPPRCRPPGPDSGPGSGAAAEAAETLEGPAVGAGAPHYCFISRGPAKNNAGHETAGTILAAHLESRGGVGAQARAPWALEPRTRAEATAPGVGTESVPGRPPLGDSGQAKGVGWSVC